MTLDHSANEADFAWWRSAPNKRMQATRLRRDEGDGDCKPCCEYAEESFIEAPRRATGCR